MRQVYLRIANEYAKKRTEQRETKPRGHLQKDDWKDIANKVFKNNVKPLSFIACRKIMSLPEVRNIANTRIMQLLDEQGLGESAGAELLKESIDLAKDQKNAKLLFEQSKYVNELAGLAPSKTVVTETRQINSNLEDNYNKAKHTITVSKQINGAGNVESGQKTRQNIFGDAENEPSTNEC